LVKFRVREKGESDKARFERFFGFEGPDDETVNLLYERSDEWQSQPVSFWEYSSTGTADLHLSPEAQILGIYLRAERDGA